MDVSQLDTSKASNEGYTLTLVHPETGAELDAKICVLGSDSDAYRDKNNEILRYHQKLVEKRGKFKLLTPEEEEAGRVEVLVACTIGWENLQLDGKELSFSPANARELYKRRGLRWIRNQVHAAIHDEANFLPKAANS